MQCYSQNFNKGKNWQDNYPYAKDEFPPNMTDQLGPSVQITYFLGADHAGDQLTRLPYSGILVYINRTIINWYRNRQNTIEASSIGSEIICGRIACENVEALTYKLWMFGIKVEGPANMYVDNQSVVKSITMPEYIVKNKQFSVCYHSVHEGLAGGKVQIGQVPTGGNVSDLLTKVLDGLKIREVVGNILN